MKGIILTDGIAQELGLAEDFTNDKNVVVDMS